MAQGISHASNMENIHKEVQRVCSGTSDNFVLEPSQKSVQADLLIAIRRFKNVVWWKELWWDQKQSNQNELSEDLEVRLSRWIIYYMGWFPPIFGQENMSS